MKCDEGILLGYSNKRKAYKYLNLTTQKVIESAHVKIEEFVERVKKKVEKNLKTTKTFSTWNLIFYLKFKQI